MPGLTVILISGRAGSGKDTAAKLLGTALRGNGCKVLITHYADLLKYICRTFFRWDGEKDERGRSLLQHVGTDVIRARNPNYWVDFVADMLTFFGNEWDYVIIPDTRFPNEIERLRERGFEAIHIRIVRPRFTSTLTAEQQMHPSETALDDVRPDYVLKNDESPWKLGEKISRWATEVLYEKRQ